MLPHPILTSHYPTAEAKPEFVNRLFDRGAAYYDAVVDWGFLHSGAAYRRWALKQHGLRPSHHLLDVACGTGLVAVEAARILGTAENITCLDPSEGMMAVARSKLAARFVVGRAEQMPLPDDSFDFLTMGYALRHVTSLDETFREYRRVLKPGGKLLILEITKPTGRVSGFFFRVYFGRIYPFLAYLFTRSGDAREMMRYYWETMDACVPPDSVLKALGDAGLTRVRRNIVLGIFSEYTAVKAGGTALRDHPAASTPPNAPATMAPVVLPSATKAPSAVEQEDRIRRLPDEARAAFLRFQAGGDPIDLDQVVFAILKDFAPRGSTIRLDQLPGDKKMIDDLGFDSLAITEVVFYVEDLFQISITNEEISKVRSLGDLRSFIRRKIDGHQTP